MRPTGLPSLPTGSVVAVVGGGLAAARTCEQLRKQGHLGAITLISAEQLAPYDRPPLSKAVLLGKRDVVPFKIDYQALDIDLRLAEKVSSVDLDRRVLETTSASVAFEKLVIATGATPIRLPGPGEQFVVRDVGDVQRLRQRLTPDSRVVIIGASWIGAEIATAAIARQCKVTCIEPASAPLAQALGTDIGSLTESWWSGVDLRLETAVESIQAGGVVLDSGEFLSADAVVTGVGARPETDWLGEAVGLTLGRGVHTDAALRTGVEGVVAVGDVAEWWSCRFNTRMSTGHWDDASSGSAVAAASIIGGSESTAIHDPVPYFWSDQFGHKLQYVGHHDASGQAVLRPDNGERGWTVCWYDAGHRLSAVLGVDRPREISVARSLIASGCAVDPARVESAHHELSECVT